MFESPFNAVFNWSLVWVSLKCKLKNWLLCKRDNDVIQYVSSKPAHSCTLLLVCVVMLFARAVHRLRMVTFSNNVEPANGFLVRYLHRKLMESEDERSLTNEDLIKVLDWVPKLWYHLHTFLEKHSTSDFLIGIKCIYLDSLVDSLYINVD